MPFHYQRQEPLYILPGRAVVWVDVLYCNEHKQRNPTPSMDHCRRRRLPHDSSDIMDMNLMDLLFSHYAMHGLHLSGASFFWPFVCMHSSVSGHPDPITDIQAT